MEQEAEDEEEEGEIPLFSPQTADISKRWAFASFLLIFERGRAGGDYILKKG